jgi:hypothetical protein
MKKGSLYIIFECNGWRSHESYRIKAMSFNRTWMQQEFRRLKPVFTRKNPEKRILNLAAYRLTDDSVSLDANAFDDFEILENTQCKNSVPVSQPLVQ